VSNRKSAEIAFFGGSFTAIDRDYMISLLETASSFLGNDGFHGIRISTRPDCIDEEMLSVLKYYGVTAIELGAQSLRNHVLSANERGHTAEDVYRSSEMIKRAGFELGLQIMPGLYGSSIEDDMATADCVVDILPDTVRIYPVVILRNTRLEQLYNSGEYRLRPFDEITELCSELLLTFERNGISVIRCGLHASDNVEGEAVGGYYHPAFKELCESRIYRNLMQKTAVFEGTYCFKVNPSCISKALGHKRINIDYFSEKNIDIKVQGDADVPKYGVEYAFKIIGNTGV